MRRPAQGKGAGCVVRFLYLTSVADYEQLRKAENGEKLSATVAATIINGMKPHSVGRTLGIGLRVAGRIAGQQVAASADAAASAKSPEPGPSSVNAAARSRAAGKATRNVARGIGGFLRPFGRVGGILWLEVTGVFFLLPVVVFAPTVWRTRSSFAHGPDHRTFLVSAAFTVVFLYLGVSSFWRARRK